MTSAAIPRERRPALPHAVALKRDHLWERWLLLALASPALLLVLMTMIVPVGWLFWLSFFADDGSFSLMHYMRMIEQPSSAKNDNQKSHPTGTIIVTSTDRKSVV